ncbi:hypothetical protein [Telmatospirillum sp.]|uniref:hypothetical protein n=1 Tax=Telmatospirillum sp. TaxID=2079197 RepID=UPI00284480F7|nr:hypothetical protein [Telmatospirillum sp.]MDR3438142.1 hypothetical protein [Telmatospirillum sp.]
MVGINYLCLIRNVSKSGAYLAAIGSHNSFEYGRIGLSVRRPTFASSVIEKDNEGIHCKFDSPIGESDLEQFLPDGAGGGEITSYRPSILLRGALRPASSMTVNGSGSQVLQSAPGLSHSFRTYGEGWVAGRNYVDPLVDLLGATMTALNPYRRQPERDHWIAGFNDGLTLAAWLRPYCN